jgi:asparagine synthase (glutamine-hydrolysing)
MVQAMDLGGASHSGDRREWLDPGAGVAMAVRRRKNDDRAEEGHQPSRSASDRFRLVYNGEIYNQAQLREELEREGIAIRRGNAAAVILAALERWGIEAAVRRLSGSFALAIWDTEERTLSLIRDRLGIKPLFAYARAGMVMFSSQLRALVAGPGFERVVDRQALTHYFRYLYITAPRSIFRDVVKVRPGQILTITDPTAPLPASRPYWSLHEVADRGLRAPFQGTAEEAADELDRLLSAAVRLQMKANVPVGALLSGGIDSSTVVAFMQENTSRPVKTFAAAFDVAEHNEAHHAAQIARYLGTEHTEFLLTGRDALDVVPRLPEIFDEPHADASQLPAYLMFVQARRAVGVAMVGDGGDELYGGYNRYAYGEAVIQRLLRVPRPVRKLIAAGVGRLSSDSWDRAQRGLAPFLPGALQQRLAGSKLIKIGRLIGMDTPAEMYRTLVSAWQRPDELVLDGWEQEGVLVEVLRADFPVRLADRMMLVDQLTYLPDDQLTKLDCTSTAAGIQVRSPLLDHHQVEFSWRLPTASKISGGRGKLPLRDLLYRRVPQELVERPKMGFTVPLDQWLRGPLRPWAEDLLTRDALERDGLLNAEPIRAAWRQFLAGGQDFALAIWVVLVFQAWRERWLP